MSPPLVVPRLYRPVGFRARTARKQRTARPLRPSRRSSRGRVLGFESAQLRRCVGPTGSREDAVAAGGELPRELEADAAARTRDEDSLLHRYRSPDVTLETMVSARAPSASPGANRKPR